MNNRSWIQGLLKKKVFLGTTVGTALVFMAIGVIFWGGFNWTLELTNTEEFCISCHEMEENVYQEYKKTIHYSNRSGVRATCPDCHVPKDWIHKIQRKIQASNELLHKMLGTIDTPEKFNEHRIKLAKSEWQRMKDSDSRECRNCHNFEFMHEYSQKPRAMKQHTAALQAGNTCIDCHKGIAHKSVRDLLTDEEIEKLEAPNPEMAKPEGHLHVFERDAAEQQRIADEKAAAEAAAEAKEKAFAEQLQKAQEACDTDDSQKGGNTQAESPASGNSLGLDWSGAPTRKITVFYPGTASLEWIHSREHGGKRAFTKGERCAGCHDKETKDMGQKIVTGEKLEENVIPGKRGSIPVEVQASYDADYLYMRFTWPDTAHAPVPFVDGGKMDPENPVKLAMMFSTDDVEFADRAGCWGTCHIDVRNMPGEPDADSIKAYADAARLDTSGGLTKYIKESRTHLELKGKRGATLGGWDQLKAAEDVKGELDAGNMLDLVRYQVGTGKVEDGYILDQRQMSGGEGAEFAAQKVGNNWVVEMKRKLKSEQAGDVSFDTGNLYNFGFAIHDDYSNSRFHHVSLGYKLGFDNAEAEVNATKR